ncbi:MAG: pyridoxal phosphate-dependent aminotransferase [Bacteroidia bacterium]
MKSLHDGLSFKSIGEDLQSLDNAKKVIRADVNDAWFEPSPKVTEKLKKNLVFFAKSSPPVYSSGLIQAIAASRNLSVENIAVSSGVSSLLYSFFPNLLMPKSKVLIVDPMYGEYNHILKNVTGSRIRKFFLKPENYYVVNAQNLLRVVQQLKPSLVVLTNPSNPTGKYLQKDYFLNMLEQLPRKTRLLIDETYLDFVDRNLSLDALVSLSSKIIVVKSFSPAFALSGLRVGYMVADAKIIQELNKFIPPWSVSLPAQAAAIEALHDEKYYNDQYKKTHEMRNQMMNELKEISTIRLYNSETNFFMFELLREDLLADKICGELANDQIFICNCDSMSDQFNNKFLRVSVQTEKENKLLVKALKAATR